VTTETNIGGSPCLVCPSRICYWHNLHPAKCELEVARKYLGEMYRLSRPKVLDEEYPCDVHIPSTIIRDHPWDMSIRTPRNPSNWLDPFLTKETSAKTGKREYPEEHFTKCEFCGRDIPYKTRKPTYNVCDACKLRIVKSHERGDIVDLLSRGESVLENDTVVTPSLPHPRYGPGTGKGQVTRLERSQMAPVDRRGAAGTRGTEAMNDTVTIVEGKRRVKGAVWLRSQAGKKKGRI
jgi:hypothetical protein